MVNSDLGNAIGAAQGWMRVIVKDGYITLLSLPHPSFAPSS